MVEGDHESNQWVLQSWQCKLARKADQVMYRTGPAMYQLNNLSKLNKCAGNRIT